MLLSAWSVNLAVRRARALSHHARIRQAARMGDDEKKRIHIAWRKKLDHLGFRRTKRQMGQPSPVRGHDRLRGCEEVDLFPKRHFLTANTFESMPLEQALYLIIIQDIPKFRLAPGNVNATGRIGVAGAVNE